MNLQQRIDCLISLGHQMETLTDPTLAAAMSRAESENAWFTRSGLEASLHAIRTRYLTAESLMLLVSSYRLDDHIRPGRVGLIMAGNIPLVGFHDLLCCFLTGHHALIKFSDKDRAMMQWVTDTLISSGARDLITTAPVLRDYDAVIATGSNTSAMQFRRYFSHVPHIIRSNRNSVAVLTGTENDITLAMLGSDVFSYFGLGCRNVSHLCVPRNYDLTALFRAFEPYRDTMEHHKYKNNLDYNLAVFLLNKEEFLHSEFLILRASDQIASRIAVLHYHRYTDTADLSLWLRTHSDEIQCIVSAEPVPGFDHIPFGQSQCPAIDTFADGVDTMQFLLSI